MSEQAGPGGGAEEGAPREFGGREGGRPEGGREFGGRPEGGGRREGGRGRRDRGDRGPRESVVFFDPARSEAELVDELAQRQARGIRRISVPELAKFYGEIKDLQRVLQHAPGAETWRQVEPRLRLLRSKAFYANRRIGQGHGVPREFRDFIDRGVQSVHNDQDFIKFARHFEAVVGFLYGMGSVQS
jgi:CRISPR type III-A-associated protein Csm2